MFGSVWLTKKEGAQESNDWENTQTPEKNPTPQRGIDFYPKQCLVLFGKKGMK